MKDNDLQYLHDQIAEITKRMFDLFVWIKKEMKNPYPELKLVFANEGQGDVLSPRQDSANNNGETDND